MPTLVSFPLLPILLVPITVHAHRPSALVAVLLRRPATVSGHRLVLGDASSSDFSASSRVCVRRRRFLSRRRSSALSPASGCSYSAGIRGSVAAVTFVRVSPNFRRRAATAPPPPATVSSRWVR